MSPQAVPKTGGERRNPFSRFLALAAGLVLLLAAAGWVPTGRLGGEGAVTAMLAALGISFLASLLGALPVALTGSGPVAPEQKVNLALSGMVVRLLAALLPGALLAITGLLPLRPFLLWLAIGYVTLLIIDIYYVNDALSRS